MSEEEQVLNGINVGEMRGYIDSCRKDPSVAERNPTVVAKWVGGSRAEIAFGDHVVRMGGDDDPSAMRMLLASLAACDVEVVATHASLLGLELKELAIEAAGHFNIRRLLGLEGPGPGYDRIAYTARINAPRATEEEVALLKAMCERSSPVGDSLTKAIPLTLRFEVAKE